MKPEQIADFVEEMDVANEHEQEVRAARDACGRSTERVLAFFRNFVMTALAPEEQAGFDAAKAEPVDSLSVVIERRHSRTLGPGRVVATVYVDRSEGPDKREPITLNTITGNDPLGYQVHFDFVGDDGSLAPAATQEEIFSWGRVMDGVSADKPTSVEVGQARTKLGTMFSEMEDTLELLEAGASDASLNPELAGRFQNYNPIANPPNLP